MSRNRAVELEAGRRHGRPVGFTILRLTPPAPDAISSWTDGVWTESSWRADLADPE